MIDSFRALLIDQVRELYDAEQLFVGALADLAGCSTDPSLTAFLHTRLADTSAHLARLEDIFSGLDVPAHATPSSTVRGLLRDSERHIAAEFESGILRDAAIAGLALQFVHHGIAAYHTALAHAEVLGLSDVAQRLDTILVDEISADRALKRVTQHVCGSDDAGFPDADEAADWTAVPDQAGRRLH